jgi:phosphate/sulfate permease
MDIAIVIIPVIGVIISGFLSLFISRHHNKIEYIKAQSKFSTQLYSARLKAYSEIYELVSGFAKKN